MVAHAYCDPFLAHVLPKTTEEFNIHLHLPHQDPSGVLFCAMLAVRRDSCLPSELLPDGTLPMVHRVRVAATLYLVQKLYINAPPDNSNHMIPLMQHFMQEHEQPRWSNEWATACTRYMEIEAEVLIQNPVFRLASENPLTHVEAELERLMQSPRKMPHGVALAIRAAAFFVLGSCLMNPDADVLEALNSEMSTEDIGRATVSVLLTCASAVSDPSCTYRHRYEPHVDRASAVLVANAQSKHAGGLRVGNYAIEGPDHAVRRLVSPGALAVACAVFGAAA